MATGEKTVRVTFTRDDMTRAINNPEGNEVLAARAIYGRLRNLGVPVVGNLGVLTVEWGKLTITHEDGLDGDEWTWEYTGKLLDAHWIGVVTTPGRAMRINDPLAPQIARKAAEDDEL